MTRVFERLTREHREAADKKAAADRYAKLHAQGVSNGSCDSTS